MSAAEFRELFGTGRPHIAGKIKEKFLNTGIVVLSFAHYRKTESGAPSSVFRRFLLGFRCEQK